MNFVTVKLHRYGGKLRKVGDEYPIISKNDRVLLQALKWVAPVVAKAFNVAQAPVAQAAEVVVVIACPMVQPDPIVVQGYEQELLLDAPDPEELPESPAPVADTDSTDKPKRVYKRRDLSAE